MKQIYLLLVVINALTAIWCAATGNLWGVILMTVFMFLNTYFYLEESEKK